jgi:signal transduction histidine kinase
VNSLRVRIIGGVPVLDVALATVLLVASVGGLVTGEVDETPLAVTLPVAVVSSLSVLGRSRAPLLAVVLTSVATLVQAIGTGAAPGSLMSLVIVLVLAFSVGAECEEGRAAIGIGVLGTALCIGEWVDHGSDYAFIVIMLGGAWLVGRATRTLRERATFAEQHQRDLARLAVADERTRIARELHDVVAHGLSVIAVQADAAEAALAKEPSRAAEPLDAIRASAREALDDMRQLLHVLRSEQDTTERSPARGLADLGPLVTGLRDAGLPLEADVRVTGPLPAGVELAVFRIAQEGLTNVVKHAGTVPTRLVVEPAGDGIQVTVRNTTGRRTIAPPASGHGLHGARERVEAAGGDLRAGRTADGGFELLAHVPLRPEPR